MMAEGMPYFKPHKTPVESSEESLQDIESQACLLFEEFLRLPQTANYRLGSNRATTEASDSPVISDEKMFKRGKILSKFEILHSYHPLPSQTSH